MDNTQTPNKIALYRAKKGLNQQQMADLLGVTKNYIGMLERGERSMSSKIKLLLNELEQNTQKPTTQINVVKVNPNIMEVPLVSQYAYAGFLSGYADPEYIESLPKVAFTTKDTHKGNYLAFEVRGDSMNNGKVESMLDSDVILCREIPQHHWRNKLHIDKWNFLITTIDEGMVIKRIIKHDTENHIITLHSLNEDKELYPDFELSLNRVAKIYNIVKINRDPFL